MTPCGHSFCLQCIRHLAVQSEEWNCPLCQTQQTVRPQHMSRNYTLEQVLQSLSLNDQQEKIDRAQHKLNVIVESMMTEMTDLQLKINELIEKQPDEFTGNILTFYSNVSFFFNAIFNIMILVPVWINVHVISSHSHEKRKNDRAPFYSDLGENHFIYYHKSKSWNMTKSNPFNDEAGSFLFRYETPG